MFQARHGTINLPDYEKLDIDLLAVAATNMHETLVDAFIKGMDMHMKDGEGNNILHIAARASERTMVRGIIGLTADDYTLWEEKNKHGHKPIDVTQDASIASDLRLISIHPKILATHHQKFNTRCAEQQISSQDTERKALLAMDGGGIKALLELTMLIEIEKHLGENVMKRVHWLGGTSCGGIISAGLASGIRLRDLRKIFLACRKLIFCGNTKMIPRHDAKGLESILKAVLGPHTVLGDFKTHKVMLTAAKISYAPASLVLFRSYAPRAPVKEYERCGYLNPNKLLVWKAARCTSAAPIYFESFNGLADGVMFCNNPTLALMADFYRLKKFENRKWSPDTENVNQETIGAVISIGAGMEPLVPLSGIDIQLRNALSFGTEIKDLVSKTKNLITLFMFQSTTSHDVYVGWAREFAHSLGVPFYRLSPKLTKAYEMDCVQAEGIFDFLFETQVYIQTQVKGDICEIGRLLRAMPLAQLPDYESITH